MREIRVLVTLQVDECDPAATIEREAMQKAAVEAVTNALHTAEDNGFWDAWADDLSIGVVDAVAYEDFRTRTLKP